MALLPTKKITALAPFTPPLTGTEEFECVQLSNSRKVTSRDFVLPADPLVTYADVLGTLPGSRMLVNGAGIAITQVDPGQLVISAAPAVVGASFVTVADEDATFPASRQLASSATINVVDNGPGGTVQFVMVGTGALPANPSALVGLTAVNGVAATWMRSDAAPALDQGIVPTWTGAHVFSNTTFGFGLNSVSPRQYFNETDAAANNRLWTISVSSEQFLLSVRNDVDNAGSNFMVVDRTLNVVDTINLVSTSLLWNGSPIASAATGFANPTGTVGLAVVNGAATTAMRSDGAPPLSQAIAPTWTNPHIFTFAGGGVSAAIRLASGTPAIAFNETDAAANNRLWDIVAASEQFLLRALDDTGASATNFMLVDRTLNTIDSIVFLATAMTLNAQAYVQQRFMTNRQSVSVVGANTNVNLSQGNEFLVTMGATTLFAFTNPPPVGQTQTFTMFLQQDGTGSRVATWPASVHWSDGITPVLTTTANRTDAVTLTTFDGGTTYYGGQVLANMVP